MTVQEYGFPQQRREKMQRTAVYSVEGGVTDGSNQARIRHQVGERDDNSEEVL
jgi:hypothetical protein